MASPSLPAPQKELRAAAAALLLTLQPAAANALPAGGQVSAGQASIATANNSVTLTQSSNKAVLDWSSFTQSSVRKATISS